MESCAFLKRILVKHAKNSCQDLQLQDRHISVQFLYALGQVRVRSTRFKQNGEVIDVLLSLLYLVEQFLHPGAAK